MVKKNKINWKKVLKITGATAVGLTLYGYFNYLSKAKDRAIARDGWSEFEDLIIKDVEVTDFVIKHLKPVDWADPYAVTTATLRTLGIYEGFGGSEKIPEGNWNFF